MGCCGKRSSECCDVSKASKGGFGVAYQERRSIGKGNG